MIKRLMDPAWDARVDAKIQRGTYLALALAGLRRRYDLWSSVGRNIVMKFQNIAAQVYLAWIVCAVPATAGSIFVARLA